MRIYCCDCNKDVNAVLISGKEIYPHRPDLASLPFWKCNTCKNFVGCHHKSKNRTQPLGTIPSPEIKQYRIWIHEMIDPLWKSGKVTRTEIYTYLGRVLGRPYHTADLRTIEECILIDKALTLTIN